MLVTRSASPWLIGMYRFFEVSLGIAIDPVVAAVWPERPSGNPRERTAGS